MAPQAVVAAAREDIADDLLTRPIGGVGFARQHDLHRAVAVAQDGGQALLVGEEQLGALVGGEATREADGQDIGIQRP